VTLDKGVYTWGSGSDGRLGHGNDNSVTTPLPVQALSTKKVIALACGAEHTALIAEGGVVYLRRFPSTIRTDDRRLDIPGEKDSMVDWDMGMKRIYLRLQH
jgi:hypothetical protein